jgi:hypothetical protein
MTNRGHGTNHELDRCGLRSLESRHSSRVAEFLIGDSAIRNRRKRPHFINL